METVDIGRLSIDIPADCPDVATFKTVIADEVQSSFGQDAAEPALCKSEYDRCQETPAPFSQNWEAGNHYRAAQMALSPEAQTWQRFEQNVSDRFSDYSLDDGSDQTPAIQGWRMDELKSSVREPSQSRSWRDRRPAAEPVQDRGNHNDKGRAR